MLVTVAQERKQLKEGRASFGLQHKWTVCHGGEILMARVAAGHVP